MRPGTANSVVFGSRGGGCSPAPSTPKTIVPSEIARSSRFHPVAQRRDFRRVRGQRIMRRLRRCAHPRDSNQVFGAAASAALLPAAGNERIENMQAHRAP